MEEIFGPTEQARWRRDMVAARGTLHAATAKTLAATAGLAPGSIIWFDNEDPSGIRFETHEFEYYAAFFEALSTTGPDGPAYRPGLYAHQRIAAQLLARHPELWIWEVDYGNNMNRTTPPPMRAPTQADRRIGLDPTNDDATIEAFHVLPAPGVTGQGWGCWPVWRQWQGDNNVDMPAAAIADLTPVRKWDWNSAIVRDPTDPYATPRVSVAGSGRAAWVARIDDSDPVFDATGRQIQPRRGRLTLRLPVPASRPVEPPVEHGWHIHPSSPAYPVTGAATVGFMVISATGQLGFTRWGARQWSPVRPLFARTAAAVRLPHAAAAAAPTPTDVHVVWAGGGDELWTARRQARGPWGTPARMAGQLLLHPFGRLAVTPAGGALHVVTVNRMRRLTYIRSTPGLAWPPATSTEISNEAVLPAADLALTANNSTLIVVALGPDLRLRRWTLQLDQTGAGWSAAAVLGSDTDTMHAQTKIAVHNLRADNIVVTAIGGDGLPRRLALSRQSNWTTTTVTRIDPAADVGRVHPLTDIATLPDGRVVLSTVGPGQTAAAYVDPATGAATPMI